MFRRFLLCHPGGGGEWWLVSGGADRSRSPEETGVAGEPADSQQIADHGRDQWNERHRSRDGDEARPPSEFLIDLAHLLGPPGKVIDLAGGQGRNGLHLAALGHDVEIWDISVEALGRTREEAARRNLRVETLEVDLENSRPGPSSADSLLCFYYLQRSLFQSMIAALRPGGTIVMETFTLDQQSSGRGPRNPAYLLGPNELLSAFSSLRILRYREEELPDGDHVASILARREG